MSRNLFAKNDGLVFRKVEHSFGQEAVLRNFDITFAPGQLVAVLGPSGCGKTTLLKIAAGLLEPSAGQVLLDGMTPLEGRSSGLIGFAFQSPVLLPWRTALENILLPMEILSNGRAHPDEARAKDLLSEVGLETDFHKLPKELSGGMQQRVSLARALVTQPRYLFLDEPFGALDGLTRDRLNEKVRQIWQDGKKDGLTILFVTHSVEEAVFLADQILILSPRPAAPHDIVPIDLGEKRDYNTRRDKKFMDDVIKIREITKGIT